MVTVAKGIDAPIKLLAPKPGSTSDFAMLGLGDIVVPGLVIALCLRFDMYRYVKRNPEKDITKHSSFSRLYFWTGIVSYIIGLATTMVVMHRFKHAQPALLYLSPACSELAWNHRVAKLMSSARSSPLSPRSRRTAAAVGLHRSTRGGQGEEG